MLKTSTPHPGPLRIKLFLPDDPHLSCGHPLPFPRARDSVRGGEGEVAVLVGFSVFEVVHGENRLFSVTRRVCAGKGKSES